MLNMISTTILILLAIAILCNAESTKSYESEDVMQTDYKVNKNNSVPQALFYRTEKSSLQGNYKNFLQGVSHLESWTNMTEIPSTTVTYDDNATTAEEVSTTESTDYGNSTDSNDNTDIMLFTKQARASTTQSPKKKILTKKTKEEFCQCDLTFHSCDVNCCCDDDCTQHEQNIFSHCLESYVPQDRRYCYSHIFYYKNNTASKIKLESDNLFCILKDNLPDKRNTASYHKFVDTNEAGRLIENFYKWPQNAQSKQDNKFKAKQYVYGDPVWSLNSYRMTVLDVPSPYLNDYCRDRTRVRFLKNTEHKCIAKVADLEMFAIYKNFNSSLVAGLPGGTNEDVQHLDAKNCSNILCIQWIISVCDYDSCEPFNETKHSPSCDDSTCVNIANKLKYVFHCFSSKINKAEMYLYITNISADTPFLQQEIIVKYYLEKENNTANAPMELSGNPGYIVGKPVIKARPVGQDAFDIFSNNSFPLRNVMSFPKNVAGTCILSNFTHEIIHFGLNIQSKCKHTFEGLKLESNGTHACNRIQNELYIFLGIAVEEKVMISPLGNPSLVTTDDWIELLSDRLDGKMIRGEYLHNTSLLCYNFVSILSYEFIYANVSRPAPGGQTDRKILRSMLHYRPSEKVQFDLEEGIFVVRTDVLFFDVTKPVLYEYARGPQLHIHVPSDFFYPFTSSASDSIQMFTVLLLNVLFCTFILS